MEPSKIDLYFAQRQPQISLPVRLYALVDALLYARAPGATALVRSGELPAIRLGSIGQWRVEHAVLESFITDKYDESRRLALWHEAEYADVAEMFPDQRRSRST